MVFLNCPKCGQRLHLQPVEEAQGIRCPACRHEFVVSPPDQAQSLPEDPTGEGAAVPSQLQSLPEAPTGEDAAVPSQAQPLPEAPTGEDAAVPSQLQPLPENRTSESPGASRKPLLTIFAALAIAVIAAVIYKTVVVPTPTVKPPQGSSIAANNINPKPKPTKEHQPEPIKTPATKPVVIPVPPPADFTNALSELDTPPEIDRRVSPSVAFIAMEDATGRPVSMGSGFVVAKGVVATSMHVIEGAASGYVRLVGGGTRHDIQGVVASDPARGMVLLAVDGLPTGALTIGDSNAVSVGDAIYAVGNPRGTAGAFWPGIVRSVRKVGVDSLLRITSPISPGSSGGPVVNSKGEVIGVALAAFKGGQNLNFAIPSRYLSAMIRAIGAPVDLPQAVQAMKARQETPILDKIGGPNTEGVQGGQLLWKYSHGQTGAYSLSLQNRLSEHVKNVVCLVVFHDKAGQPIDVDLITHRDIVPAGLASRITSEVDGSIHKLTTRSGGKSPHTRIEFRILNFDIVNADKPVDN